MERLTIRGVDNGENDSNNEHKDDNSDASNNARSLIASEAMYNTHHWLGTQSSECDDRECSWGVNNRYCQ